MGRTFRWENEAWIDAFGASITFDQKLVKQDILGSLAHVKMLVHTGIISQTDGSDHWRLDHDSAAISRWRIDFTIENEDIHLNIETFLHELIGPVAGKLHTARSRNDQVATDMHLYLKEVVQDVITLIAELREALVLQAEANIYTIMPGYTHHAQPISLPITS